MLKKSLILAVLSTNFLFSQTNGEFASDILNHFKGDLGSTINAPLSSNAPIVSVDGKSKGVVSLTCDENNPDKKNVEYLNISYNGSDDIYISVSVDRNLDGVKEGNFTFSGISGICNNGFAKCGYNTFDKNCEYYQWDMQGDTLYGKKAKADDMVGCYCTTARCGGLASNQRKRVLDDISASISRFFGSKESFLISGAINDGYSVKYYGSDQTSCNQGKMPNVSRDTHLESAGSDEMARQLANKDSLYSSFQQSAVNNNMKLDDNTKNSIKGIQNTTDKSLSYNTGNLSYSYADKDGKKVDNSYQAEKLDKIKYCEVSYSEVSPSVFGDNTVRGQSTNSNTIKKGAIRECKGDVCPINTGESIKHACGGIDDFAEVIGALSGVEDAVGDMTCSR